ncbi:methyltransferase domain-containing protein [Rugosimonospora africana]|uniref:Methyltransferase type 12 n=1 Tax=Rugosimonospora africana TaxID=556532 RepID=A0A8J3QQC5_9ACTN|nr:class I SAM-dependent methyltransferase [Rugosimonospora africana]GIH15003.1 methyltransferase type 12 [Rugosimonospora africana]
MTAALSCYGRALRQAAAGRSTVLQLLDPVHRWPPRRLNPRDWCGDLRSGDSGMLDRCVGSTLDVGCGPGRLTAALAAAGRPALGVDVSAEAIRQARRRGAPAHRADVFAAIPDEGSWQHILLADGNIGIGGDPRRLLARCLELLGPDGDILVELDPPGSGTWSGPMLLRHDERTSQPFLWAVVAADDLPALAEQAGLSALEFWGEAQRWFARLART